MFKTMIIFITEFSSILIREQFNPVVFYSKQNKPVPANVNSVRA